MPKRRQQINQLILFYQDIIKHLHEAQKLAIAETHSDSVFGRLIDQIKEIEIQQTKERTTFWDAFEELATHINSDDQNSQDDRGGLEEEFLSIYNDVVEQASMFETDISGDLLNKLLEPDANGSFTKNVQRLKHNMITLNAYVNEKEKMEFAIAKDLEELDRNVMKKTLSNN
jgi:hypothetical protein